MLYFYIQVDLEHLVSEKSCSHRIKYIFPHYIYKPLVSGIYIHNRLFDLKKLKKNARKARVGKVSIFGGKRQLTFGRDGKATGSTLPLLLRTWK